MNDPEPQSLPQTTHASSAVTPIALPSDLDANRNPIYPDLLGAPPIPPPRTSSTQRSHHGSSSKATASSSERASSSRHGKNKAEDRSAMQSDREVEDLSGMTGARGQPVLSSAVDAHSDELTDPFPDQATLAKESSTVLNQLLVSDPAVDIEREQVRQGGASISPSTEAAPTSGLSLVGSDGVDDGGRGGLRSRHDYNENAAKRKETTFGQYILGQTLGEGEFGKVKLGWKRDGTIQVAIKLIRRESLGSNPSRLPKIYREISILRDLAHPNIVRLHEMVETDRHIGIIMEYASGGELFDHILNNRYLKDNAARRLFAQLVSGVGYLHKKGIVHRDLKLENLLLDRNRNIIITDFGFANTFDPADELGEEIEYNLANKDFVKRMRLDKPNAKGLRRGDLMQTSCGSPCYAAPELVVSDSLYTGRKVDVWSCGVILYAMLAGYLPFDDDPANPDGDNINLLYKYIVTTPLTFPEYVTPHARDLLRRILVPDPRKRADLFEVARHSWLSEYSHVVSHITSSTTKVADIATTTVPSAEPHKEVPLLARSASVREPPKAYQNTAPPVGGLIHHAGDVSQEQATEKAKSSRDTKRRTVQVEYVAPQSQTVRGEQFTGTEHAHVEPSGAFEPSSRRARSGSRGGPVDMPAGTSHQNMAGESSARIGDYKATAGSAPAPVSGHLPRSTSDTAALTGPMPTSATHATRPTTGGSMASFNAGRLPSRGSYGQPVAPTVAATNAQGRLAQPKSRQFSISAPMPHDSSQQSIGQPSTQHLPPKFNTTPRQEPPKGHKRSNTVSSIGERLFGRSGSIFGGRGGQASGSRQRNGKRYPPTSMKEPYGGDDTRMSMDSRRSMQYGYNRKASETGVENRPRRFSLLPPSFSLKGFSSSRSQTPDEESQTDRSTENRLEHPPSTGAIRSRARATSYGTQDAIAMATDGSPGDEILTQDEPINYQARIDQQFAILHSNQSGLYQPTSYSAASAEQVYPNENDHYYRNQSANHSTPNYYDDSTGTFDKGSQPSMQAGRPGRGPGVLPKNHRKFADAYEYERDLAHRPGSSGAARKVMDFFRRRAKSRAGDDR
ncbi:putative serine/threonine protein kinase (Kin4) [Aspergillus aculeatinus CBS 121060]|uniref:Serine/threonine protein kinase n=1 Tax=Aspergillus aculeatinus CBS 121060 TaxID=1448322 RepID=A0ACD1H4Y2_9EURO|nr:serine/threonine protein kinase [Aspergillus aculeatinus CBS 121060]RAH68682.1 serine/threonine protein kinase [Aspergillus aculeatinus CBS 121060]